MSGADLTFQAIVIRRESQESFYALSKKWKNQRIGIKESAHTRRKKVYIGVVSIHYCACFEGAPSRQGFRQERLAASCARFVRFVQAYKADLEVQDPETR